VSRKGPEPTTIFSVRVPESMIAGLDRFAAELPAATTRKIGRGEAARLILSEFFAGRAAATVAETDPVQPVAKSSRGEMPN
jgi:hypothetical protein